MPEPIEPLNAPALMDRVRRHVRGEEATALSTAELLRALDESVQRDIEAARMSQGPWQVEPRGRMKPLKRLVLRLIGSVSYGQAALDSSVVSALVGLGDMCVALAARVDELEAQVAAGREG